MSDDALTTQLAGHLDASDTQAALDAGTALAYPVPLDLEQTYMRLVPAGARAEVFTLEQYALAPRRITGLVRVARLSSLERYVVRHDHEARTTLWVDDVGRQIIAVLNDHAISAPPILNGAPAPREAEDPQWGDHRAVFKLVPSPEWLHWLKNDGKLMDQQTFAEHVEEGIVDIADPPGARMLELAQSMQGTVKSTWQSAQRLTDGQVALKYVEEASASAGAHGEVKIPESFLLGLAVFVGEAAYKVTARFRYRVREGRLLLGYKLDRPEEVVLAAVDRMEERLAGQFVGRVFVGTPRQSRHPAATS